jgi:8-oxo-dGTP diphosphatase
VNQGPRFCTECGGRLEWKTLEDERHPQPVCTKCGHVEWQNPKPTVSALLTRRGSNGSVEVLLVRRARPPYRDAWDTPGGFIDPDEHPVDALRRELREELGVEAEVGRFFDIFMDRYGPGGESTLNLYFEGSIGRGVVQPGSDASEARWFPLNDLPVEIAFDNNRRALESLAARDGKMKS